MQYAPSQSRPRVLALCTLVLFAVLGAANPAPSSMVVTFAIHDYTSWRPVFDHAAVQRAKAGVTSARVYRDADKPNNLLVVFGVASEASGRAWMTSAAVKADWKAGGVVGEPSFHFLR